MNSFGGPGQPTLFIAHRGGSLEAPENTLAAARHGVRCGAHWQECDVTLSADGVPVVIHDDSLERTTDGRGLVESQSVAELTAHRAGRPLPSEGTARELQAQAIAVPQFGGRFADQRLPTLDAWLATEGLCPMLELKKTDRPLELAAAVVAALRRQPPRRCVVGSFERPLLEAVHRLAPHLPLLGIMGPPLDDLQAFLQLPLQALAIDKNALPEARLRLPVELPIWTWTVYSPAEARQLVAGGAHGIITDAPQACLSTA